MSDDTILRGAEAPDYTGDAPGAFVGDDRPLGARAFVMVSVRVEDQTTESHGRDDFWPEH